MIKTCVRGIAAPGVDKQAQHAVVGRIIKPAEGAGLIYGRVGQDLVRGLIVGQAVAIGDVSVVIVSYAPDLLANYGLIKEIVPEHPVAAAAREDGHGSTPEEVVVKVMVGGAILGIEIEVKPIAQTVGQRDRDVRSLECACAELTILKGNGGGSEYQTIQVRADS